MKNKLTLKNLQQQLDDIKLKTNKSIVSKGRVNNVSLTQEQQPRKSAFTLLAPAYILSLIMYLSHKIPFINRITSILKLYYGRTTIWKILTFSRKTFILFNACLGIWGMVSMVGIETGSLASSFAMIGNSYIEIFTSSIKRLFRFFVDFLDTKVVPDIPQNRGSAPSIFYPNNIDTNISNPFRSTYKSNIILDNVWYKDWTNWAYIGLGLVGIATIVCVSYLGYNYIQAVYNPEVLPSRASADINIPSTSSNVQGKLPEIEIDSPTGSVESEATIIPMLTKIRNKLNPFNWISNVESNKNFFHDYQSNINTADTRFYPFTTNNPTHSWLQKFKLAWIGETTQESVIRSLHLDNFRGQLSTVNHAEVAQSLISHSNTFASSTTGNSYSQGTMLGLGLQLDSLPANPWVGYTNSPGLIAKYLSSLPPTPLHSPVIKNLPLQDLEIVNDWITPNKTYAGIVKKSIPIKVSEGKYAPLNNLIDEVV